MAQPCRTAAGAQILTGMGGVGKTPLAARFARQLLECRQLDLLVWVTAPSRDAIVARYAEAATVLGLAGTSVAASDAATGLLAWLAHTEQRWLVMLDNLDSPADAAKWWPPMSAAGRTLVTSRVRDVTWERDTRTVIPIGLFTPQEAVTYLHSAITDPIHRDGAGNFLDGVQCSLKIDSNRAGWLHVVRPGDWDGHGWNDLVVVEADSDLPITAAWGAGSFYTNAAPVTSWDADGNQVAATGWNRKTS
ncbi:NB-ARC domain-containing protein [Micromonospora parva]|uniref:NB-ARC domain-containing protein n=1 Tax=Micromonospora parva TaxID=1464048 RepID=UPI0033F307C9